MVRRLEPNGSCIHEKGPYKGHVGNDYRFLSLTPVGTGYEDVDTGYAVCPKPAPLPLSNL